MYEVNIRGKCIMYYVRGIVYEVLCTRYFVRGILYEVLFSRNYIRGGVLEVECLHYTTYIIKN